MRQADLLDNWVRQKTSGNFRRLCVPIEVEHEFKGRFGHPSSYAYVKFQVDPAEELSFATAVLWPSEFDADYTRRIHDSIAEAIVSTLFNPQDHCPFRGCAIQLIDFRWDSVGGSEHAVKRATAKAMELLRTSDSWEIVGATIDRTRRAMGPNPQFQPTPNGAAERNR
uniref:hypothetical protein n=1 Tax=Pelomonas sp. KK5 TaxID=1855730 RepID=UPI00117C8EF2